MHDDLSLAALLGEAPPALDPGFRIDVFVRAAARARRRAARARAMQQIAAFTAIGLIAALVQNASVLSGAWTPMLGATGALAVSGVFALVVIEGPKAALARSTSMFRLA
jgi:hypothetical protein